MALEKNNSTSKKVGLFLGPVLFLITILFFDLDPGKPEITSMAAVAILMATWWITDAIPLFATALLPLVLFPLLGILNSKGTAPVYINSTIFLFIGGFLIALTMEKWNLHKRIALFIIKLIGGSPSKIILGFMIASAFLSMWISNTATAIMMIPIALPIILKMEEKFTADKTKNFTISLMLGIAYGCSLGGIATLVGTPPNLSLQRIFAITFPNAPAITFGDWIIMALPISIIMIAFVWFLLTKIIYRVSKEQLVDRSIIDKEYSELGLITYEEKVVLTIFAATAFLWVFRKPLNFGILSIPGWSELIPFPKFIDDGTVAIFMSLILFLIPSKNSRSKYFGIAGPELIKKLPWNIVLLFGGGFALAKGFQVTGLSELIGNNLTGLQGVPPFLIIITICALITFLTELTSNTATTEMILPIIAAIAVAIKVNPLLLMIPATISASCAFMMPVATPPNAIVFGSGRIEISEMVRGGLIINIVGIFLISIVFYFIGTSVFGIDLSVFPDWAG